MGGRPHSGNQAHLRACDQQLQAVRCHLTCPPTAAAVESTLTSTQQELAAITDEVIYSELQASDMGMGRWTAEDPSLRAVQRWVRTRRC